MLLFFLIKQSKTPNGFIGKYMIKIWNKSYRDLYVWSSTLVDRTKYTSILDIGIGGGLSTKYLSDYFFNAKVIGVDYSATAVEQARIVNVEKIELGTVGIIQGDVINLGLKKNNFDLVTAFQTHFHWSDFEKGLVEIYKVMKSDSILILACEQNKLNYYLKLYNNLEKMKVIIEKVGFSEIKEYQKNQFVCFIITKK